MPNPKDQDLPEHILDWLRGWIFLPRGADTLYPKSMRIVPGSFLDAVLCNDLSLAVGKADDKNILLLPAIITWIFNNAPSASWGSKEKVEAWRYLKERP